MAVNDAQDGDRSEQFDDTESQEEGDVSLDALSASFAQLIGQPAPTRTSAPESRSPKANPSVPASLAGTDAAADEPSARAVTDAGQDEFPITPLNLLEAIVFVGHPDNEPLTSQLVADLIRGVESSEVDDLVRQLNAQYDEEGRPYEVVSVGAGYRLLLREEFAALRDKFYGKVREARLSQAAIDVLSVVAYEQPVTRKEVEAICQRPAAGLLNQLVRRQLLQLERAEDNPREPRFRTTDKFLSLFGLKSLDELPRSQSLERDL